jgi:hypothetical protein
MARSYCCGYVSLQSKRVFFLSLSVAGSRRIEEKAALSELFLFFPPPPTQAAPNEFRDEHGM